MAANNLTIINVESWFIPTDILMMICTILVILLAILFLCIMISNKACHIIPMMFVANTCLTVIIAGSSLFSLAIFTFKNDIKQMAYQDSLCAFRGYLTCVSGTLVNSSFLLQAFYRYIIVAYPMNFFWQTVRTQFLLILSTWICSFAFSSVFLITNELLYNVNNQICHVPFHLSISMIYLIGIEYLIPVSLVVLIYFKLILYVKRMNERVTLVNTLNRARCELKMLQSTVILVIIQIIMCLPYAILILISFFTTPPIYHYRIGIMFVDVSLLVIMIVLLKFTDPLKISLMKWIIGETHTIIPSAV